MDQIQLESEEEVNKFLTDFWSRVDNHRRLISLERKFHKEISKIDSSDSTVWEESESVIKPPELAVLEDPEYMDRLRIYFHRIPLKLFQDVIVGKAHEFQDSIKENPGKFSHYFLRDFYPIITLKYLLGDTERGNLCADIERMIRRTSRFINLSREYDKNRKAQMTRRITPETREKARNNQAARRSRMTDEQKEDAKKKQREAMKRLRQARKNSNEVDFTLN